MGKIVALIGDARLSGRADIEACLEMLLGISGGDHQDIQRKGLSDIPAKLLYTRFVVFANELPSFEDASGALAHRFSLLRLVESFADIEDLGLEDKLTRELPGILAWAILGWQRLRKNGRFTKAQSAQTLRDQSEELISPVKKFAQEWCDVSHGKFVLTDDLYDAWQAWCSNKEKAHNRGKGEFGKKLFAAFPKIDKKRPRDSEKDTRFWEYQGIGLTADGRTGLCRWRDLEKQKLNR